MPRIIWGTITVAAFTALAGCGGSSSTAGRTSSEGDGPTPTPTGGAHFGSPDPTTGGQATPSVSPGNGTGAQEPHCTTGMLTVTLSGLDAGTGDRYAALTLTNKSGRPCTAGGWSGLQLLGAAGKIPTRVFREGRARTIVIPGGGHAYERLHWAVVPAGDETGTTCEPVATALRVIPPNQTEPMNGKWRYGPVCRYGEIRLTPLATTPPA
ncbi:DUF4232 domain-containing protein [Actinomadura citrea]|uniref:DUF4232 domain-containing protein n=1 Tax=Actinomadura citrea TaxID=46158 RepID=A0A7Y9KCS1_9ACTN|nr:DUF4232 domain-containing protein [Actinomadura citrea]NYE11318.1 hypothetical protein [Actinomadura citrea]GGT77175.1 hypothetical protein GCM10010177_39280 [Actinomadura citrea]